MHEKIDKYRLLDILQYNCPKQSDKSRMWDILQCRWPKLPKNINIMKENKNGRTLVDLREI